MPIVLEDKWLDMLEIVLQGAKKEVLSVM